jgi:hypothetical protein
MNKFTLQAGMAALMAVFIQQETQAATIATFTDPGTTSFAFADDGNNGNGVGYLTAGNSDISVFLPLLGLTFSNASFTLTDSTGSALATTNAAKQRLSGSGHF